MSAHEIKLIQKDRLMTEMLPITDDQELEVTRDREDGLLPRYLGTEALPRVS
jgi:hypothetical protein